MQTATNLYIHRACMLLKLPGLYNEVSQAMHTCYARRRPSAATIKYMYTARIPSASHAYEMYSHNFTQKCMDDYQLVQE